MSLEGRNTPFRRVRPPSACTLQKPHLLITFPGWTFRKMFFFPARGRGRGNPRPQGGVVGLLAKIPGGEGSLRRKGCGEGGGGGRERVCENFSGGGGGARRQPVDPVVGDPVRQDNDKI